MKLAGNKLSSVNKLVAENTPNGYGHLDRICVYKGQEVYIGNTLGRMGKTGWATGPHLHFEIRVYGIPVNPMKFLGV